MNKHRHHDSNKSLQQAITHFKSVKPEAKHYHQKLKAVEKKLAFAQSKDEFFELVDEIIEKEKGLYACLGMYPEQFSKKDINTLDSEIENTTLSFFSDLIHFDERINQQILFKKAELSMLELEATVDKETMSQVKAFIYQILKLQDKVDSIRLQKEQFKERLMAAKSMDEINRIEREISNLSEIYLSFFENTMHYPEDESVAGILVNYLETNRYLLDMILSFNFLKSLTDDILRAKCTAESSQ